MPAPAEPIPVVEVVEEAVKEALQPEAVVEPVIEEKEAEATQAVAVPEESTVEETVIEAVEVARHLYDDLARARLHEGGTRERRGTCR